VEHSIDGDGDGELARAPDGSCGTDCNDRDPTVGSMQPELCNNSVDDNCNGVPDEGERTGYFVDCDGDSYPPAGAVVVREACSEPLTCNDSGCPCTDRAPAERATDCNDNNADVHPYAGPLGTPIPPVGEDPNYDYDCDGVEKLETTCIQDPLGECPSGPGPGGHLSCGAYQGTGWIDFPPPECGRTAMFAACSFPGHERTTRPQIQRCN
jgi:hypothetical protein